MDSNNEAIRLSDLLNTSDAESINLAIDLVDKLNTKLNALSTTMTGMPMLALTQEQAEYAIAMRKTADEAMRQNQATKEGTEALMRLSTVQQENKAGIDNIIAAKTNLNKVGKEAQALADQWTNALKNNIEALAKLNASENADIEAKAKLNAAIKINRENLEQLNISFNSNVAAMGRVVLSQEAGSKAIMANNIALKQQNELQAQAIKMQPEYLANEVKIAIGKKELTTAINAQAKAETQAAEAAIKRAAIETETINKMIAENAKYVAALDADEDKTRAKVFQVEAQKAEAAQAAARKAAEANEAAANKSTGVWQQFTGIFERMGLRMLASLFWWSAIIGAATALWEWLWKDVDAANKLRKGLEGIDVSHLSAINDELEKLNTQLSIVSDINVAYSERLKVLDQIVSSTGELLTQEDQSRLLAGDRLIAETKIRDMIIEQGKAAAYSEKSSKLEKDIIQIQEDYKNDKGYFGTGIGISNTGTDFDFDKKYSLDKKTEEEFKKNNAYGYNQMGETQKNAIAYLISNRSRLQRESIGGDLSGGTDVVSENGDLLDRAKKIDALRRQQLGFAGKAASSQLDIEQKQHPAHKGWTLSDYEAELKNQQLKMDNMLTSDKIKPGETSKADTDAIVNKLRETPEYKKQRDIVRNLEDEIKILKGGDYHAPHIPKSKAAHIANQEMEHKLKDDTDNYGDAVTKSKEAFEGSNKSFADKKALYDKEDELAQQHATNQLQIIHDYAKASGETDTQLKHRRDLVQENLDKANLENQKSRDKDLDEMKRNNEEKVKDIDETIAKLTKANEAMALKMNELAKDASLSKGKDKADYIDIMKTISEAANKDFEQQKKNIQQTKDELQSSADFEIQLAGNNAIAKKKIQDDTYAQTVELQQKLDKVTEQQNFFNASASGAGGIAKGVSGFSNQQKILNANIIEDKANLATQAPYLAQAKETAQQTQAKVDTDNARPLDLSNIEQLSQDKEDYTANNSAQSNLSSEQQKQSDLNIKLVKDKQKANQQIYKDTIQVAQTTAKGVQEIGNAEFDLQKQRIQQQMNAVQGLAAFELGLAGNNSIAKRKIAMEEHTQMLALKRKEAEVNKQQAIFNAIINVAEGVTAAFANGPIIGAVLAAIVLAAGIVEISAIQAAPLPSYAKGRGKGKQEIARVNEQGFELIENQGKYRIAGIGEETITTLAASDKVHTHSQSLKLLADKGGADWMSTLMLGTGVFAKEKEIRDEKIINAIAGNALSKHDFEEAMSRAIKRTQKDVIVNVPLPHVAINHLKQLQRNGLAK